MTSTPITKAETSGAASLAPSRGTAFGSPRDFFDNRFVYTVISPRTRGLSVGVNINPDKHCNFDCAYREVNRHEPSRESRLDVRVMIAELERTLELVRSGGLRPRPCYRSAPLELLELRHVTLSGDGEPTLRPNFVEAVEAVVHLRARGRFPSINGEAPPASEIERFVQRLAELKEAGAQIRLVQIYSATRPRAHPECGHLPLRTLSHIAQRVRDVSGLKAEVF